MKISTLTFIAISFCLGILTGSFINIPIWGWLVLSPGLFITAFLSRNKKAIFFWVFLLFCLSLGALHIANYNLFPPRHIGFLKIKKSLNARIHGIVDNDPAITRRKTSFYFKAKKLIVLDKAYPVRGEVLVNAFSPARDFHYGDELILEGNLHRPFDFNQEANFSYPDYLKNQGIYYILEVGKEKEIVFLGRDKGSPLSSLAFKLKRQLKGIFEKYLWPVNSAVLSGIALGDRHGLPARIREDFVRTGTAHIIAISGFNVGIVVFAVLFLLKSLRIRRKCRYLLAIPILFIHMCAVGAQASVVRATLMAVVVLIGYLLEKDTDIINSLSLAALIILGYNPLQIFDIGFQLSFVSLLGIIVLSPKFSGWFKLKPKTSGSALLAIGSSTRFRGSIAIKFLVNSLAVSLAAWLATAGFVGYYFRIVTPISILANLIIVPLVSLIIILGFTLCLAAVLCPMIAWPMAVTANFFMLWLFKIANWLSALPLSYFYLK